MQIPLRVEPSFFTTHGLLIGSPGSGKSRALLSLYLQLLSLPNVRTTLFDVEGELVRALALAPHPDVLVLDCGEGGNFRYNLLDPTEGATLQENVENVVRSLSTLWLGVGGAGEERPHILELMKDSMAGKPHTLRDLRDRLQTMKYSEMRGKVLGRLAILDNPFFDTTNALGMNLVASHHLVFRVNTLDSYATALFLSGFLSRLQTHLKCQGEHSKEVQNQVLHMVLLDEAQRLLASASLDRDDIAFMPTIDTNVRGRKLGIGFIAALQQPSMIHRTFISTAGFILAGPLNDEADTRIVRSAFNLTPEQLQYYRAMPPRAFLLHRRGSVLPVTIPEIDLPEVVWDKERRDAWNAGVLGRTPLLDAIIYKESPRVPPVVGDAPPLDTSDIQPAASIANSDERIFLEAVNNNPCRQVTDYYAILHKQGHMGQDKAAELRGSLEKGGMLKVHSIRTGARGVQKGLEITEDGYRAYQLKPKLVNSRGADYVHTFIVETVKRYYEGRGAQVRREAMIGTHFLDLLVEPGLLVEVAVGNKPSQEVQNILADMKHGGDGTLVIGNDPEHLARIQKALPEDGVEGVQFKLFCEFLKGKQDGRS